MSAKFFLEEILYLAVLIIHYIDITYCNCFVVAILHAKQRDKLEALLTLESDTFPAERYTNGVP